MSHRVITSSPRKPSIHPVKYRMFVLNCANLAYEDLLRVVVPNGPNAVAQRRLDQPGVRIICRSGVHCAFVGIKKAERHKLSIAAPTTRYVHTYVRPASHLYGLSCQAVTSTRRTMVLPEQSTASNFDISVSRITLPQSRSPNCDGINPPYLCLG